MRLRSQPNSFPARVSTLTFAVPGIIVVLLVCVMFWLVARLIQAGDRVDHTDLVVGHANAIEKQVLDLETGFRGYMLTRKPLYLEPYNAALPTIEVTIDDLKHLVADNPQQVEKLTSVQEDVARWMSYSRPLVERVNLGKDPTPYLAMERGKQIVDRIRATMQSFIDAESVRRSARVGRVQGSSRSITVITGLLLLMTIGVAVWRLMQRTEWEKRLLESEERFRVLVDNIQDYAIYVIDPTGNVVSWNEGAARLKGFEASEIIGKPYSTFFTPEAVASDEPGKALKEAIEKGFAHREGWRVRKDGSRFWAEVVLTPIFKTGGQLYGFAKVTRDLTERKKFETDLKNALRTERAAVRSREDILAIVSHDLKNPLLSIQLNVELVRKLIQQDGFESKPITTLQKLNENIGRSASQANQLIQDLLNWAKIESGNFTVDMKPMRISSLIDEVITSLTPIAQEKGVTLKAEPVLSECVVLGDSTRMTQVLMNLTGNAIKFSKRGGVVRIHLNGCGSEFAEILVEDNGTGISAEALPHIFDRYWQPEETKKQGTGLGLSIAKGIIEAHGGQIWVKSAPGIGSTFGFTLRRANEGYGSGLQARWAGSTPAAQTPDRISRKP